MPSCDLRQVHFGALLCLQNLFYFLTLVKDAFASLLVGDLYIFLALKLLNAVVGQFCVEVSSTAGNLSVLLHVDSILINRHHREI